MTARGKRPIFDDAMREAADGRVELATSMLGMSPNSLAACDPGVWERIGPENRARLLNHLAAHPETLQLQPVSRRHAPHNDRLIEFAWMIEMLPVPVRGLLAGLIATCVCVGVAASWLNFDHGLIGPVVTPSGECTRLMLPNEGCFYRVDGDALTWATAAARIGVEEHALRAGNVATAGTPLGRGSIINIDPIMAYGPHEQDP